MRKVEHGKTDADRPGSPASLTDADMTTTRVNRRSFFSRAVAAGSIAVAAGSIVAAAALTAACPGGTDSDGGGDSDGSE